MKIAVINSSGQQYNYATHKMVNLFTCQGHEVYFSRAFSDRGIGGADMWARRCDKAYLSVIFTFDLPRLVQDTLDLLASGLEVEIGGPAATAMPEYIEQKTGIIPHIGLDERFEHISSGSIPYQAIFTSRGCPHNCAFCLVSRLEGRKIVEYDDFPIPSGKNPFICDNNILATSWKHQTMVVDKLKGVRNLDINSGFDDRIFIKNPEKYWNLYSQLDIECYSEDTEVLTDGGFKKFSELARVDQVATLNQDGFLEYQKPMTYYGYPYKGEMISFQGRSYDFLVTPRHQMWVKPYRGFWQLREAWEVTKTSEVKRNLNWAGRYRENYLLGGKEYPMELCLKFLGWWLSEGSATIGHHKNGTISGYQVTIHQEKEANRLEIQSIIEAMGFHFGYQKDRIVFNNKDLCLELQQFGAQPDRFIPQHLRMLPPEQLQYLFNSLLKGDGSQIGERYFYYTTSRQLASDVADISLKLGYCVTIGEVEPRIARKKNGEIIHGKHVKYALSISKSNETPSLQKGQKERIAYDGMVYCVDVPNHTLLVKRNGKIAWSGNCWRFAYDSPEQKEPIKACADFLHDKGVNYRRIIVFCLVGWPGTTFEFAREKLQYLIDIGTSPYAMRYMPLDSVERHTVPPGWERDGLDKLYAYFNVPFVWRSTKWSDFIYKGRRVAF